MPFFLYLLSCLLLHAEYYRGETFFHAMPANILVMVNDEDLSACAQITAADLSVHGSVLRFP